MDGGVGPSRPFPALFPSSNTFPSSTPFPEPTPIVQEIGETQKNTTSKTRSRSKSKRKVAFASDPRPGSRLGDSGGTEGPPPAIRDSSRTKDVGREAEGGSEVDQADQGSESDAAGSGEEGRAGVDPSLSSKSDSVARGRTPGPRRR